MPVGLKNIFKNILILYFISFLYINFFKIEESYNTAVSTILTISNNSMKKTNKINVSINKIQQIMN